MVAVSAVAAETDEEAEYLSGPSALSFLRLRAGRPEPMATPEEAAAYPYSEREREFVLQRREGQALGSPETVRKQLSELLAATRADEFMLTCMVYDLESRARSFDLIRTEVAPALHHPAR